MDSFSSLPAPASPTAWASENKSTTIFSDAQVGVHEVAIASPQRRSLFFYAGDFLSSGASRYHRVTQSSLKKMSALDCKQAALRAKSSFPSWVHEAVKSATTRARVKEWQVLTLSLFDSEKTIEGDAEYLKRRYDFTGLSNLHGSCYMNASLQMMSHFLAIFQEKGTREEQERITENLSKMPSLKKLVEGTLEMGKECRELHQETAELMIQDFSYSLLRSSIENEAPEEKGLGGWGQDLVPILLEHLNVPPLFLKSGSSSANPQATYSHFIDLTRIQRNSSVDATVLVVSQKRLMKEYLSITDYKIDDLLPTSLVVKQMKDPLVQVHRLLDPFSLEVEECGSSFYQPSLFYCGREGHAFSLIRKRGEWHEVNDQAVSAPFPKEWKEELELFCADHAKMIVYEKMEEEEDLSSPEGGEKILLSGEEAAASPRDAEHPLLNEVVESLLELAQFSRVYCGGILSLKELTRHLRINVLQENNPLGPEYSFIGFQIAKILEKGETLFTNDLKLMAESEAQEAMNHARESCKDADYTIALHKIQQVKELWSKEIVAAQHHRKGELSSEEQLFWERSLQTATVRRETCEYEQLSLQGEQATFRSLQALKKAESAVEEGSRSSLFHEASEREREARSRWEELCYFSKLTLKKSPEKFALFWEMQTELAISHYEESLTHPSVFETTKIEKQTKVLL